MTQQCGLAKNTAAAIQFLDSCEAVTTYDELNDDWLEFAYDDSIEVFSSPDHLVWWFDGAAPAEAIAAQNAFHNSSSDEKWLNALTQRIARGDQDVELTAFARSLDLEEGWDWGDVLSKLLSKQITREQIETAVHAGLV